MSNDSDNSIFSGIFGIILCLYIIAAEIFAAYFWWLMAKEDSFIATILIDPFIAEIKGLLWPFFL